MRDTQKKFYRGGYLNGREIRESLDDLFLPGTVADPDDQIQQAGIDLTLKRIYKGDRLLSFDQRGWTRLCPGSYWVEFNEKPISLNHELRLQPRSSTFRPGATLAEGIGKVTDWRDLAPGAQLVVTNPFGLEIEMGVKISQAMVLSRTQLFETPHPEMYQLSEKLTVGQIFRYVEPGKLGKTERSTGSEEVEGDEIILGSHEGCYVRFEEVVRLSSVEVAISQFDRPYPGITFMGAVVDPGWFGQLSACFYSFDAVRLCKGAKGFRLWKSLVSPVNNEDLYQGKYQGMGVKDEDPETAIWHPAGWVPTD